MKSFSLALLLVCAPRHVTSARVQSIEAMSLDVDESFTGSESSSDTLKFPEEVLSSPECAAEGKVEASGYLLFSENKDTNARNFNSMDVGYVPARLPGPVDIVFTAKYASLEIVDLARGTGIIDWGHADDYSTNYLGSSFSKIPVSTLSRSTDNERPSKTLAIVEPTVPATLLLRVVIHVSRSEREEMEEDGVAWELEVSWASPAQSGCSKSPATGVKVPLAYMVGVHTNQYMPFMPGFLAVLRRGSSMSLQVPTPSPDALELLRLKASESCAHIPHDLCRPDSDKSAAVLAEMGFACKYQDRSSSCEAMDDYHGPAVHLEGSSVDESLWQVKLEVTKSEVSHETVEEICNQWNVPDSQRETLLKERLGYLPEDWQKKKSKVCTRYLGELAMSRSGGASSCAWEDGSGRCHAAAIGQSILERTVLLPADMPVGRAALLVNGQFAGAVAVICNPWSPEDPTYLTAAALKDSTHDAVAQKRLGWSLKDYSDDEARRDYVLKMGGFIFKGAASNGLKDVYGEPWDFHQFRSLYYALSLVDQLPTSVRANVVLLARKVPVLINSFVLAGNWGEIKDGEQPGFWTSGAEILRRAYRMSPIAKAGGSPMVRYGQCFVFAGVTGSVFRALGVPARVVTNFQSAHDTQPYDWLIREVDGDSVWNFHVWNEAWFSRADLYGSDKQAQWNVLDATPQELSEGEMQMGPAALRVIRRGADDLGPLAEPRQGEHLNAEMNYDVAFAIAEANAVETLTTGEDGDFLLRMIWSQAGLKDADKITCQEACADLDFLHASVAQSVIDKIKKACPASCKELEDELFNFHAVGLYMSTEAPRCTKHEKLQLDLMGHDSCREDVTANYKASPCPTKQFCEIMEEQAQKVKDLNTGSRTYLTWSPKLAQVGDTVEINLWQEVPAPCWVQVIVKAISYTGKDLGRVAMHNSFWTDGTLKIKVSPQEYFFMLGRTNYLRVVASTWPQLDGVDLDDVSSSFHADEVVTLLPTQLDLRLLRVGAAPAHKLTEEVQWFVGDVVTVGVRWQNPFPFQLADCVFGMLDWDDENSFLAQDLGQMAAGQRIDVAVESDFELTAVGEDQITVVLQCAGLEPVVERFSFLVEEQISKADQELNDVFDIVPKTTARATAATTPSTTTPQPTAPNPTTVPTTPNPTTTDSVIADANPSEKPGKCRVGEHVPCCPDGKCSVRCAGDQCCPGRPLGMEGSFTCPSASRNNARCTHPKLTDCTKE